MWGRESALTQSYTTNAGTLFHMFTCRCCCFGLHLYVLWFHRPSWKPFKWILFLHRMNALVAESNNAQRSSVMSDLWCWIVIHTYIFIYVAAQTQAHIGNKSRRAPHICRFLVSRNFVISLMWSQHRSIYCPSFGLPLSLIYAAYIYFWQVYCPQMSRTIHNEEIHLENRSIES